MVHFVNDDFSRPPPEPNRSPAQQYRANIIFQGKLIFVICLNKLDCRNFLVACQQLLLSQRGITQEISLLCLDTIPDTKTNCDVISEHSSINAASYKISSDIDLRAAFESGCRRGGTVEQNFSVVVTNKDANCAKQSYKNKILKKQMAHRPGKKLGVSNVIRAFHSLEKEASRSRNLQSQLRVLNRAFKQIMYQKTRTNNPAMYERRRRQFAAMLVTMRKRPQRASAWLSKMQRQHAGNTRMLQILSILNIFVNNLVRNASTEEI